MSAAARDLAVHLAKQVQTNPELAHLIGPYSQTWQLLCAAIGSITGESSEAVYARLSAKMARREPAPEQAGEPADDDD